MPSKALARLPTRAPRRPQLGRGVADYISAANSEVTLMVQCETRQCYEELEVGWPWPGGPAPELAPEPGGPRLSWCPTRR